MFVYTFRGKGLALSSEVVVLAKRQDVAHRIAVDWCKQNGVDADTLHFVEKERAECPMIVYAWNGDY